MTKKERFLVERPFLILLLLGVTIPIKKYDRRVKKERNIKEIKQKERATV